jgi:hypothetical protein
MEVSREMEPMPFIFATCNFLTQINFFFQVQSQVDETILECSRDG